MKMFEQNGDLDADVQDTLYELGNVGLGMASVTIGKILGVRVMLESPVVVPLGGSQIKEFVMEAMRRGGGKEIGLFMEFQDTLQGMVLLIMNTGFLAAIVNKMTGCAYEETELVTDEISFSAISEFANMISAAYAKAIGSYTGMRVYLSPVMMDIDCEENLLQDVLDKLGGACKMAISVQTDFILTEENGEKTGDIGHFIMLPVQSSVESLMKALGM